MSVEAIAEEKAKAAKVNEPAEAFGKIPQHSESFRSVPHGAETGQNEGRVPEEDANRLKELEKENMDLKIINRGKDYFIEQIQKERNSFIDQVLTASRKMGELETKLLQLGTSSEKSSV